MWPLVGYLFGVPTVAQQLREAREALRLDIQQVADATKLKNDHVRALEEGDYSVFTAPIYLRGSLRTYARLLKLDADKLLAELQEETSGTAAAEQPNISPARQKSGLDSFMLILSRVNWVIAGILIAIVLVIVAGNFGYKAWQKRKTADPLKNLSPGAYQPPADSGERLLFGTNVGR